MLCAHFCDLILRQYLQCVWRVPKHRLHALSVTDKKQWDLDSLRADGRADTEARIAIFIGASLGSNMSSIVYHDWQPVITSKSTLKLCKLCGAFNDEDNLKLACHSQHSKVPHDFTYSRAKPRDPFCRVCLHAKSDCPLNCKERSMKSDATSSSSSSSSSSSNRVAHKQNVGSSGTSTSKKVGTQGIPKKKGTLLSSSSKTNNTSSIKRRLPSVVEDDGDNDDDSDESDYDEVYMKYKGKNQAIKRRKNLDASKKIPPGKVSIFNAGNKTKASIHLRDRKKNSMKDEKLELMQMKIEEEKRRIEEKDRREKEEVQKQIEEVKLKEQKKELEQQRRRIEARALIDRESKKKELDEMKKLRKKDDHENTDIWFNGSWLKLMEPLENDFHSNDFTLVTILQGPTNREFR